MAVEAGRKKSGWAVADDLALELHATRELLQIAEDRLANQNGHATVKLAVCPVCQAGPGKPCLGIRRVRGKWAGQRRQRLSYHQERYSQVLRVRPQGFLGSGIHW